MTIIEWFDISNMEHMKAYKEMSDTGIWPVGFIPDEVTFVTNWQMIIASKMADAYMKLFFVYKGSTEGIL